MINQTFQQGDEKKKKKWVTENWAEKGEKRKIDERRERITLRSLGVSSCSCGIGGSTTRCARRCHFGIGIGQRLGLLGIQRKTEKPSKVKIGGNEKVCDCGRNRRSSLFPPFIYWLQKKAWNGRGKQRETQEKVEGAANLRRVKQIPNSNSTMQLQLPVSHPWIVYCTYIVFVLWERVAFS